jgi:hypothetical protein
MQPSRTERLNGIVAALSEYINVVRGYDMQATAVLLDMAKIDLQTRIHAISDREFRALCDALELRQPPEGDSGAATTKLFGVSGKARSGRSLPIGPWANLIRLRGHQATVIGRRRSSLESGRTRKNS